MAKLLLQLLVLACFLCLALALPALEFPIVHRDAPGSPFRNLSTQIPDSVPLKLFVAFGLSLRARLHRSPPKALLARFSYLQSLAGDFYLPLPVGSPPQNRYFVLDTGSELLWTQCLPCIECSHINNPFRPERSSSYQRVPCNSSLCVHSLGFSRFPCGNVSASPCVFELQYGDGSADIGYLSVDDFHFGKLAIPFVFGCAVVDIEVVPLPSSGVIGLNAGPFSLPSQLVGSGYAKKFAYCLPDRIYNLNSSGLIRFGDSTFPTKLSYTPLVPPFAPLGQLYYYVGLQGISVGNQLLKIPSSSFAPNSLGQGGTLLDSGTAITRLTEPVYRALVNALIKATGHLHPFSLNDTATDVCYNISVTATRLPEVPSITFHFLDKVDLELEADSILYPVAFDEKNLIVCAAFASTALTLVDSFNIIGNYQQQNYWIEYDLTAGRVGFAKANCASI